MNPKRKQKETHLAIPENCERFRQDGIGRWEFQFPGCIDDTEWEMVEVVHNLAGCVSCPEMRLLWQDLCNAARCAWLDEAERERDIGSAVLSNEVYHLIYLIASEDLDVGQYPVCEPWEIDYAHCLAHAEAWAREGRRETDKD